MTVSPTRTPDARTPGGTRQGFHSIVDGGLDFDALPMRLFVQGNQKFWDPSQIDFSQDAEHWKLLDQDQQEGIATLAVQFLVGEEAVTEDIQPFMQAMAAEGRLEDEMYLTQFAFEEAKHVEVFRRWFDAVGAKQDLHYLLDEVDTGDEPFSGIFTQLLPEAMDTLRDDPSPRAQIRANVVYNQFVEGTLALTGYWAWSTILESMGGLFPGMQELIRMISRDERRHLAWGTYNIRRHVAADDAMWDVAKADLDDMMTAMTRRHEAEMADTSPEAEEQRQRGRELGVGPERSWAYQVDRLNRRYGAIESARGAAAESIEHDLDEGDEGDEAGYASLAG